jgi:hypothetical protein
VLEIDDEQGVHDVLALADDPLGFSLGACSTLHLPVNPEVRERGGGRESGRQTDITPM